MTRLLRTYQAREDVLNIWMYIARDDSSTADRFVAQIDDLLNTLARSPGLGKAFDVGRSGLRTHPVGRYLIFYEPIRGGIRVVRVLHGARRYERLL